MRRALKLGRLLLMLAALFGPTLPAFATQNTSSPTKAAAPSQNTASDSHRSARPEQSKSRRELSLPDGASALPILSCVGAGALAGGLFSALKLRHRHENK